MEPCTITCFFSLVIIVSMFIMTFMVSNDPFIKSYRDHLPSDIKDEYDRIVVERRQIYFTGYLIGFVVSIVVIRLLSKNKLPVSAMICLTVVVSTIINYFYYILSPKSNYMVNLLTTDQQRKDWLQIYKSMQYYYHFSYFLGAIGVGVFAYAFRGSCQ